MVSAINTGAKLLFGRQQLGQAELLRAWQSAGRIMVPSLSGIGDAIMAVPLIAAIRERRPGAHLTVCIPESFVQLLDPALADSVIPADTRSGRGMLSTILHTRRVAPDIVFYALPFNTLKHSLIAVATRGGATLKTERDYSGESWRDFGFLYSCLTEDRPGRHEVELNLDLLRALGEEIPDGAYRPSVHVPAAASREADAILSRSGDVVTIAVHPGGVWPSKQWGAANFAATLKRVAGDLPFRAVMLGAGGELPVCREIIAATPELEWIDASGRAALPVTAALLERCDVLLSNDTGIMHLASAVGTPAVAVFGPTDPRRIGPYDEFSRPIWRPRIEEILPDDVAPVVLEKISACRTSVKP